MNKDYTLYFERCIRCTRTNVLCLSMGDMCMCKRCIDEIFGGRTYDNFEERLVTLEEGMQSLCSAVEYLEEKIDE